MRVLVVEDERKIAGFLQRGAAPGDRLGRAASGLTGDRPAGRELAARRRGHRSGPSRPAGQGPRPDAARRSPWSGRGGRGGGAQALLGDGSEPDDPRVPRDALALAARSAQPVFAFWRGERVVLLRVESDDEGDPHRVVSASAPAAVLSRTVGGFALAYSGLGLVVALAASAALLGSVRSSFAPIAGARRDDPGGLGLGLPLAREVARRHGGTCVLERSERGGALARLSERQRRGVKLWTAKIKVNGAPNMVLGQPPRQLVRYCPLGRPRRGRLAA